MDEKLVDAFAWCLEAVEAGRLTQEECLARYPGLRGELGELLSVAGMLSQAP